MMNTKFARAMSEVVKEVLKECEVRYGVDCEEMIKEYEVEEVCLDKPPSIKHPSEIALEEKNEKIQAKQLDTEAKKEAKRLEAEAKQKEKEAKQKEKEAKQKEKEAKQKEKEAKQKEKEAKRLAAEEKKKNKTEKLLKLTAKEKKYVISEWHHAKLSYFQLHPTEDNRYDDLDLTQAEIEEIIKRYGIQPPSHHWYWNDVTGASL
jgi:hypothetical protein